MMDNIHANNTVKAIPLKIIAITVLMSCAVSLGALYITWQYWLKPREVVSFDLKGTTNTFLLQSAKLNITAEQQEQLLRLYNDKLNAVLQRRVKQNQEMVIAQPAAIAGIRDITPQIRQELAQAMEQARKAAPEAR
ncbi:TrbI F-type domain-containing protein [Serratia sp. UGAL515B_01]|uniref:TrbI F-type domain-containing protein n=1 Tax=Serratia sp. UGAL515B_01 TaxID=2986763 RepID=UPI00295307C5|nr:TrbI F-type domain-containing protein [Serratia sp. UGAL515B_01]WON75528.1 type-F conjugative transfer system protein TrbI [Serratia sp. UGAL515B_01]